MQSNISLRVDAPVPPAAAPPWNPPVELVCPARFTDSRQSLLNNGSAATPTCISADMQTWPRTRDFALRCRTILIERSRTGMQNPNSGRGFQRKHHVHRACRISHRSVSRLARHLLTFCLVPEMLHLSKESSSPFPPGPHKMAPPRPMTPSPRSPRPAPLPPRRRARSAATSAPVSPRR